MSAHRIALIHGDGIGPELVDAATAILDVLQSGNPDLRIELQRVDAGAKHYLETGVNISDDGLEACRAADAILKGPAGLPDVRRPDGTEGGSLGGALRSGLDTYANVRPILLWPGVNGPLASPGAGIDYVIVRENTEGLYASRGLGIVNRWAASDTLLMTRAGVERIVRFAFHHAMERQGAPADGVSRVTCVDKANVLRTFAFFRSIFDHVASEHPGIEAEYLYTDAAAQALVMQPEHFDVIVTENFVGDLLSDLGGATVGGIGMCASGNVGANAAYFEPIHGSAPQLAGQDRANPLSQILSAALMLDYLGEGASGELIRRAIREELQAGASKIGADGCPVDGLARIVQGLKRRLVDYVRTAP